MIREALKDAIYSTRALKGACRMGMTDAQIDAKMDLVKPDDKHLVRDVLRVIEGFGCCSSYVISAAQRGYEVLGWVSTEEVLYEQMELIEQVDILRVRCMGVRLPASGSTMCIRVRVISKDEPIMMNENILFKQRKKAKFWDWGK